jgi:predicted DNA-binding antitoxin AbrB/MazE fold protein
MSKQIAAIYEGGVIRPLEPPDLTEGEELDVVLLPRPKQGQRSPAEILAEIAALPLEGEQKRADALNAMQEAMHDELFLADLRETMEDFRHADVEEAPA